MIDAERLLLVGAAASLRGAFSAVIAPTDIVVAPDAAAGVELLHKRADIPPRLIVLVAGDAPVADAVGLFKRDAQAQMVPLLVCANREEAGQFDACFRAGANACVTLTGPAALSRETVESVAGYWLGANEAAPPSRAADR